MSAGDGSGGSGSCCCFMCVVCECDVIIGGNYRGIMPLNYIINFRIILSYALRRVKVGGHLNLM